MKKDLKDYTAGMIGRLDTDPAPVEAQEEQKPAPMAAQPEPAPAAQIGKEETKSIHMHILIRPSTKAALKRQADATGNSVNDLINKILEEYTERTAKE